MFGISTLAANSKMGFLAEIPKELSWVCVSIDVFNDLQGFDERFQSPGGGWVSHDFCRRAMLYPAINPIVLLGEGAFHQFHNGIATNAPFTDHPSPKFAEEYENIRGESFTRITNPAPFYLGKLPKISMQFVLSSYATGSRHMIANDKLLRKLKAERVANDKLLSKLKAERVANDKLLSKLKAERVANDNLLSKLKAERVANDKLSNQLAWRDLEMKKNLTALAAKKN